MMMEYTMDIKVRYSECGEDGRVNLHQILNYFQDCATFQSEQIGYGLRHNRDHHLAWFVLAYDINFYRRPQMFEDLTVVTCPYKMKGHYGYRYFYIRNREGEDLVCADSMWILMDTDKLLPVRIPDDMSLAFVPDPGDDKVRIRRKIRTGDDWVQVNDFDVNPIHLDTNRHVNNNFYALWTENLLNDGEFGRVRIDYRKAAVLGDHIIVSRQDGEGLSIFRYENGEGDLLAYLSIERS